MGVFLIQVNGEKTIHSETKAEYFWEEPIKYKVYINYYWKMIARRAIWEKIDKENKVLIYCTGNVKPYPGQIRHIATIKKSSCDEKAEMYFKDIKELPSGVSYGTIQKEVKSGELSEGMKRCGQQGFNISEVEESDLERILELSGST